jgi:threonine/homoserine/homoserine lactone efflux protein
MSVDLLGPLALFCVVTLFTPGPNNVMLMTSGLNYGFQRTTPHLLGVALGFGLMVALVGLGLGAVIERHPLIYTVMRWGGAAYLLYLAWAIANSGPLEPGGPSSGRPMTFFEAAAFQWVNPKAWVMAVGAMSTYASIAAFPSNVAVIAGLFGGLGLVSAGAWVLFGEALRRLLTRPAAVRAFNLAMAILLVVSLIPVLADGLR